MNIYSRIANINKEIKAITKSQRNNGLNFNFRGIDDVMNELHNLFAKNEVVIIPEVLESRCEQRTTVKNTIMYHTHIHMKYTFVASDGSSISAVGIGEAMDTADKGANKAMSIALKYVLLQTFLIPTQETKDPDAYAPEETKATQQSPAKQPEQISVADLQKLINECKTAKELKNLFGSYGNDSVRPMFTRRKEILQKGATE